jgi:integrase
MKNLDMFLVSRDIAEKALPEDLVTEWLSSMDVKTQTRKGRLRAIRPLLKYLASVGIEAAIPEMPRISSGYVPYIFSSDELTRIMDAADNLPQGRYKTDISAAKQLPVLLRLLYGCGLRVGEAISLKMSDVDLNDGIIVVRNGKGSKGRYIPLGDEMTGILKMYCSARKKEPFSDEWLFENTKMEKHCLTWVRTTFIRCLEGAGISKPSLERNARNICPHCLRYTFAVHSFMKQEQLGTDVYAAAPLLSAYMGHSTFRDTEYYLRLTAEIGGDIVSRAGGYAKVFPEVPQ